MLCFPTIGVTAFAIELIENRPDKVFDNFFLSVVWCGPKLVVIRQRVQYSVSVHVVIPFGSQVPALLVTHCTCYVI